MVEDLVLKIINNNGVNVTDSRDVATMLGKTHSNLMRDIRSCIRDMKKLIKKLIINNVKIKF